MDPQYFFYQMQWWEVQRYIDGMRRRLRPQWESTRWLAWMVSKLLGSKDNATPDEMVTFPWEKRTITPEEQEAEAQAAMELVEECRRQNQKNKQQS